MNSMTGFGKAEQTGIAGKFVVEISSINTRFLEMSCRLPRAFFSFEAPLRELIGSRVSRGKVTIYVGFEEPEGSPDRYPLNRDAVVAYYNQLEEVRKQLKLTEPVRMSDMLAFPEVLVGDTSIADEDKIWPELKKATTEALDKMVSMRRKEGEAMSSQMSASLDSIAHNLEEIIKLSPEAVAKQRERIRAKVTDLLEGTPPDERRIEEEIAILAERMDIAEECTRLDSHIQQYRETLNSTDAVGKRLNFLLQEMNREANTIASKCSDIAVSRLSLATKEEIEKLRELVQNVE